jgi:hypothetical protein
MAAGRGAEARGPLSRARQVDELVEVALADLHLEVRGHGASGSPFSIT